MLSAHSPSRPEALTYTRLRRVLQSIVGYYPARSLESIRKHQTATGEKTSNGHGW